MMAYDYHVFPARKYYDTDKKKWRKAPAVPKGEDWRTFAAEPHVLKHSANVGVVIPQGVVVIDLDTYKGVTREAVNAALGVTLDWEGAKVQRTVSGGEHFCFTLPEGAFVVQGDSLLGLEGFDTRCAGKGWICTGEGYTDLTSWGMPAALLMDTFPTLPIEAIEIINAGLLGSDADGLSDLESAINAQPLDDLSPNDLRLYVAALPVEDLEHYTTWLKVGMALHHQTRGDPEALKLWLEWSKGSTHFDEAECREKWKSFNKSGYNGKRVRFDYVIGRAGGRSVIASAVAEDWAAKGAAVTTFDDYEALKIELRKVSLGLLGKDQRQRIAKVVHDGYGKAQGITRTAITDAISPPRSTRGTQLAEGDRPQWLDDWVYLEIPSEFANTALNYSIRREAFCAKYDRQPEVVIAEKAASAYALNDAQIPTLVDRIFWPGAGLYVEYMGKQMLNFYQPQGCEPCESLDDEGQQVIDRLLAHIHFTLADERERAILLDWFTFVYCNPGKRVNWALLLQGAQGTGKSYFAVMLQALMGDLVANLDPAAIAGRFTSWAFGSLVVVIEEVRISGQNKYEVMDRTKPFISNPTIQIEEKGRDHRTVPNFTSYFMLTNHKDALPLVAGDRRYCVMFSRIQSEAQLYAELGGTSGLEAYFDQLFSDLDQRPDAIAHYFKHRKISAHFNARGRAPDTLAKQQMVDVGISPERMVIEDALSQFECAVIGRDLIDITWLNALAEAEGLQMPRTRAVSAILLEMGYQQVDGRKVRMRKTKKCHYIWFNPEYTDSDKARDYAKNFHDDPNLVPF
jgi:hypothetical protein